MLCAAVGQVPEMMVLTMIMMIKLTETSSELFIKQGFMKISRLYSASYGQACTVASINIGRVIPDLFFI